MLPSNCVRAWLASASVPIVTKAKPRTLPVARSLGTLTCSTLPPVDSKSSRKLTSVAASAKPATNSLRSSSPDISSFLSFAQLCFQEPPPSRLGMSSYLSRARSIAPLPASTESSPGGSSRCTRYHSTSSNVVTPLGVRLRQFTDCVAPRDGASRHKRDAQHCAKCAPLLWGVRRETLAEGHRTRIKIGALRP